MSSVEISSRPELSFLRQSNGLLKVTVCQYLKEEKKPTRDYITRKFLAFDGVDRYEIPNSSWSGEKDGMPSLLVGGEKGNWLDEIPPNDWFRSWQDLFPLQLVKGRRRWADCLACYKIILSGFCLSPRFQHTSSEVQRPICSLTLPHRTAWESYYWQ